MDQSYFMIQTKLGRTILMFSVGKRDRLLINNNEQLHDTTIAHCYLWRCLCALTHQERVIINMLKGNTCAFCNTKERIVSNMEWDVNFLRQSLVKSAKQRTATCQPDTVLNDIGVQFWWSVLQSVDNGLRYVRCSFRGSEQSLDSTQAPP